MKAQKVLKRIAKIEALISKVTERSSARATNIRELLRDAKAAVIRAKEAVQASLETPKNLPVKHSSKATPEASKPKRKPSAAGRKAKSAGTKKRRTEKKAAVAKPKPVAAKKATPKKAAPVKAAKARTRKVVTKTPAKKVAAKAAAKKAMRVVQAATTPAPPPTEDAAVKTLEQIVPESPIQQADEPEASR